MRNLTISTRLLSLSTAYLLAIYAIDLSAHIIDLANLSIPRFIGGMSLLTWIPLMVVLIMGPMITKQNLRLTGTGDLLFVGTLLLWVVIEWMHGLDSGYVNYTMISASLAPYLAYIAVRSHFQVFDDRQVLIDAILLTTGILALGHIFLLVLLSAGISPVFFNSSEIAGRNGISLLLVIALFVALFLDSRQSDFIRLRTVSLIFIALLHSVLNQTRAAIIIVVLLLLAKALLALAGRNRRMGWAVLIASGLLIILVTWSYDLLVSLKLTDFAPQNPANDTTLSTLYRTRANLLLVHALFSSPWMGLGYDQVMSITAGGYISHTLYLLYLGAYGIFGIFPFIMGIGIFLSLPNSPDWISRTLVLFLIVAVTSFVNDPMPLFGVLIAMVLAPANAIQDTEG